MWTVDFVRSERAARGGKQLQCFRYTPKLRNTYKHNQLIGEENQSCQVTYIHVDKTCGLREVSPFVSYSRDLGLMEISLNA